MKQGANSSDVNAIKRLHEGGMATEQISLKLQISEKVVKSFIPEKPKSKKSSKLAEAFN